MRFSWLAALCLLTTAPTALARSYELDDMMALESYGKAVLDPQGRWAVIDRFRRYDSAAAYDFDAFTKRMLGRVMLIDTDTGKPLEPLFEQSDDAGYWSGSASPNGKHLTVFRLQPDRLSLGVVNMQDRTVRWLDINPVTALLNPVPIWRDNSHLIVITSPDPGIAYPLDSGHRLQRELPALWKQSARGKEPGVSVLDSTKMGASGHRGHHTLQEINIETGATRTIGQGAIVDVALSANNTWVAVTEELDDAAPQGDVLISASARPWQHGIRVINLVDGRTTEICSDCDTMPNLLDWSPSNARLLFFSRERGQPWTKGSLQIFDTSTMTNSPVGPAGAVPWIPETDSGAALIRAGWWDDDVLFLAANETGPPVWRAIGSESHTTPRLPCQPMQLLRLDRALLVPCPDGLWQSSASASFGKIAEGSIMLSQPFEETFDVGIRARYQGIASAHGSSFVASLAAGSKQAIALDRPDVPAISLPENTRRLLSVGGAGQFGLTLTRSPERIGSLWLSRQDHEPVQIDQVNAHLDDVELPRAVVLSDEKTGNIDWLFMPTSVPNNISPALIITPYPGSVYRPDSAPPLVPDTVASAVNPLLLTSLGYAVLIPSIPHDRDQGEPAANLAKQLEAAADRAIASGQIDPDRIAIYGHSFGGYTALVAASHSSKFKAYIAGASAPDLTLQHGQFMPYDRISLNDGFPLGPSFGWAETGQARLRASAWQDPERYLRNSPYYQLEAISAPLLLIHGDLDPVAVVGTERLFSGLYRVGGDVTLLRYWGEAHVVRSPSNIRDMWSRVDQWLNENLAKAPPTNQ